MNLKIIEACRIQEDLFSQLKDLVIPGFAISMVNDFITEYFNKHNLDIIPGSLPITLNLNNIIYHGLVSKEILENGDVLTIDVCYSYKGAKVDGAVTYPVGKVSETILNLIEVNRDSLTGVIDIIKSGLPVSAVIHYLSDFISQKGYFLLSQGMGHGIGLDLHQQPFISLNDFSDFNYIFKKGDVFTIEPIILLRSDEVYENMLGEGYVSDNNISSQFEIMLLIDEMGSVKVLNGALLN